MKTVNRINFSRKRILFRRVASFTLLPVLKMYKIKPFDFDEMFINNYLRYITWLYNHGWYTYIVLRTRLRDGEIKKKKNSGVQRFTLEFIDRKLTQYWI